MLNDNQRLGSAALQFVKKKLGSVRRRVLSYGSSDSHVSHNWFDALERKEKEALQAVRRFDLSAEQVRQNSLLNAEFIKSSEPIKTINWFVPYFAHIFAGLHTILRFAARLHEYHGIHNNIVVYDCAETNIASAREKIGRAFPVLEPHVLFHSSSHESLSKIPAADACIATFWNSAYLISEMNNTRAKFYFIQDYEPLFYEAGTIYGLAETTYRLGLLRIVNTPGLLDTIESLHGEGGVAFTPSVDRQLYFPDPVNLKEAGKSRIFFYGRPQNLRNGFLLGIEALRQVKETYQEKVEIITAGAEWDMKNYEAENVLTNVGVLTDLKEVGALYRSCHIGLVFMFTKHPSYQPFEFMASGCSVVSNKNNATTWLLKHGENALLTEPTIKSVSEAIASLVDDPQLRYKLVAQGLTSVPTQDWNATIDDVCHRAGILQTTEKA